MVFRRSAIVIVAAALAAAGWTAMGSRSPAADRGQVPPDLFYNYYVPPDAGAGLGAKLYVCPRPTPPFVGHTYFTYEPLMPHEFLYPHARVYTRYHEDGSFTRTRVHWH